MNETNRPSFPKRAVVTSGMPYGSKELHIGHIGIFVLADIYARFLRDRIGYDNVIFVSGTDCYGSPITEGHRELCEAGKFEGSVQDFARSNHNIQKDTLKQYSVELNLFAASSLEPAADIHAEYSKEFITRLYENGHLKKMVTSQFFDTERGVFLNGRQVVGQCPIAGCQSNHGYADECSLGHQYMPADLVNPKSTLSGKRPEMRDITNWYFDLTAFRGVLKDWAARLPDDPTSRKFAIKAIEEFLEPPVIFLKRELLPEAAAIEGMPPYELIDEEKKTSVSLVFAELEQRERACELLAGRGLNFRTGKTLVPFRLTGNIEWGVPAPVIEGLDGLTVWVWPESLWAPISFTKTYLKERGCEEENRWKDFWCSRDARAYQFIGEDNIYFYGPVEAAMFMGQHKNPSLDPPDGELQIPSIIDNKHILFLDKKASSSGNVKPPTARELLNYYTPEQLRAHFMGLGLGLNSASLRPKPLNPTANERDGDPVLNEGSLLTNVFNRVIRSCFYSTQKYFDGKMPVGEPSNDIVDESRKAVLDYERLMYTCTLHPITNVMDTYIRGINKYWSKQMPTSDEITDELTAVRKQVLVDCFHMIRTAAVLMHPIAPVGTEMIREYLNVGEKFWSWDYIFEPIYYFMDNPETHELKFLEPRVDFFKKHESQIKN